MANSFAANAVLLGRESEGRKGGGLEIRKGAVRQGKLAAPNPEADVLEAKEIIGNSFGSAGVFTRPQEEVEGKDEAVRRGEGNGCGSGMSKQGRAAHNAHRKRLHTGRRLVRLFPRLVQGGEAHVHDAKLIQARVRGPHPGERLPHASYGVLHCARTDRVCAAGEAAVAVPMGEELEKRYLVAGD